MAEVLGRLLIIKLVIGDSYSPLWHSFFVMSLIPLEKAQDFGGVEIGEYGRGRRTVIYTSAQVRIKTLAFCGWSS